MKILHVCVKDGEISTEITEEKDRPSYIPVTGCEIYFIVAIDSEHVAATRDRLREGISPTAHLEDSYKHFFGILRAQGFTITPPDK